MQRSSLTAHPLHGRVVDEVLRNRHPDTGAAETYRLWTYYRADGAVLALVRAEAGTGTGRAASDTDAMATGVVALGTLPTNNVVRKFFYDTVGRRLSSDDPDTDNPADGTEATNSWRYLFNEVGDLVAVRDPRGCGQNFFYDFGGRLRGEQYVACTEAQSHSAERPSSDNSVGDLIAMAYSSGSIDLDVVYDYDGGLALGRHAAGGPAARVGRGQQPRRADRPPRCGRVARRPPPRVGQHPPRRALPRRRRRVRLHADRRNAHADR